MRGTWSPGVPSFGVVFATERELQHFGELASERVKIDGTLFQLVSDRMSEVIIMSTLCQ